MEVEWFVHDQHLNTSRGACFVVSLALLPDLSSTTPRTDFRSPSPPLPRARTAFAVSLDLAPVENNPFFLSLWSRCFGAHEHRLSTAGEFGDKDSAYFAMAVKGGRGRQSVRRGERAPREATLA